MSALSSGFEGAEAFYKVVPPKTADLRDSSVGVCYRQRSDICWLPDRGTTIWMITKIENGIAVLQPNTGDSNRPRWQRQQRRVPLEILKTEYKACSQQRQYPPC